MTYNIEKIEETINSRINQRHKEKIENLDAYKEYYTEHTSQINLEFFTILKDLINENRISIRDSKVQRSRENIGDNKENRKEIFRVYSTINWKENELPIFTQKKYLQLTKNDLEMSDIATYLLGIEIELFEQRLYWYVNNIFREILINKEIGNSLQHIIVREYNQINNENMFAEDIKLIKLDFYMNNELSVFFKIVNHNQDTENYFMYMFRKNRPYERKKRIYDLTSQEYEEECTFALYPNKQQTMQDIVACYDEITTAEMETMIAHISVNNIEIEKFEVENNYFFHQIKLTLNTKQCKGINLDIVLGEENALAHSKEACVPTTFQPINKYSKLKTYTITSLQCATFPTEYSTNSVITADFLGKIIKDYLTEKSMLSECD